ncbi:hypothetical protein C8R43DRAFT_853615, partial [Mycena crocata]
PTFAKHSRFWMLDGNVILRFESVAFKVHRSRLSTQSIWFEKLFERRAGREEPLEEDEENIATVVVEDLDGCDVYHLDPLASVEDFEALLTAMEDAIEFYYAGPQFLTASAVFRAATVFKFEKFEKFTKKYLLDMFSNRLEDLTVDSVAYSATAVDLGRTWNLPGIIKRAMYELVRAPPEAPPPSNSSSDGDNDTSSPLESLEANDVIRLLNTQKHLSAEWLSVLTVERCPAKPHCTASNRSAGWSAIVGGKDRTNILHKFRYDPICGLDALIAVNWISTCSFCEACAGARRKALREKQVEIWRDLDRWFEISYDGVEVDE